MFFDDIDDSVYVRIKDFNLYSIVNNDIDTFSQKGMKDSNWLWLTVFHDNIDDTILEKWRIHFNISLLTVDDENIIVSI